MQLAARMGQLGTESAFEVLAKAKRLEAQGRDIVHLEIGQPDFTTPAHICEAAYRAMQDGYTGYSPSAGIMEFREAAAEYVGESRGVSVSPEQIAVTPGAKPIIFFSVLACVNEGDEVIYPDPGFPTYESVVRFVGAKPVPIPLVESSQFRFRMEDLHRVVSDRTKLLIINSPQNPTGGVLTQEDLAEIARLAIKHDFLVLSDEVYSRILYDGEHTSVLSIPGMAERTILIEGHSKTYAMTGWRLGYGVMPTTLAEAVTLLMINSNSCTCTFTQVAGVAALKGTQEPVNEMVREFQGRRDAIVAELNTIPGVTCAKPSGAFYVFPNITAFGKPAQQIADYLLDEANVALLPGTSFGQYGEGYLRISYATSMANLMEAASRLREALGKLGRIRD